MLVLSRRVEETIEFPALGISVRLLRSTEKAARIGVDAPRDVAVVRGEILTAAPSGAARGSCASGVEKLKERFQVQVAGALETLQQIQLISRNQEWESGENVIVGLLEQLERIDHCVVDICRQRLTLDEGEEKQLKAFVIDESEPTVLASC